MCTKTLELKEGGLCSAIKNILANTILSGKYYYLDNTTNIDIFMYHYGDTLSNENFYE